MPLRNASRMISARMTVFACCGRHRQQRRPVPRDEAAAEVRDVTRPVVAQFLDHGAPPPPATPSTFVSSAMTCRTPDQCSAGLSVKTSPIASRSVSASGVIRSIALLHLRLAVDGLRLCFRGLNPLHERL